MKEEKPSSLNLHSSEKHHGKRSEGGEGEKGGIPFGLHEHSYSSV